MERPSLETETETESPVSPVSPVSLPNYNPSLPFSAKKESKANKKKSSAKGRSGGSVMLEGYVESADGGGGAKGCEGGGGELVARTKSLTDEDLEDLKGCFDLGFGFNYEEIPELCNTLPALELCYSMSQKFLDEQHRHYVAGDACGSAPPIANWKISSPGDDPDEVKARLKYWAQAVACTVRLCN